MFGVRRETIIGLDLVRSSEFVELKKITTELRRTINGPFELTQRETKDGKDSKDAGAASLVAGRPDRIRSGPVERSL